MVQETNMQAKAQVVGSRMSVRLSNCCLCFEIRNLFRVFQWH